MCERTRKKRDNNTNTRVSECCNQLATFLFPSAKDCSVSWIRDTCFIVHPLFFSIYCDSREIAGSKLLCQASNPLSAISSLSFGKGDMQSNLHPHPSLKRNNLEKRGLLLCLLLSVMEVFFAGMSVPKKLSLCFSISFSFAHTKENAFSSQ